MYFIWEDFTAKADGTKMYYIGFACKVSLLMLRSGTLSVESMTI